MSEESAPSLSQGQIMAILCNDYDPDGYRLVSNDDTGEEWRHAGCERDHHKDLHQRECVHCKPKMHPVVSHVG